MHERGPQEVRPLVDEFFRRCSEIVVSQDGIIDHFMGGAVLALFNVPIQHKDHIARAVRAASQIQAVVPHINASLKEEGLLKVGVGVTTGLAFTGVVGSDNCNGTSRV